MSATFWNLLARKKVLADGRKTPPVLMPSPIQSPATGRSPVVQKLKKMSAKLVKLLARKKAPGLPGRNTPIVSMPSPFQSPAIGRSPAVPKLKTISAGGVELLVRPLVRKKV